MKYIILTLSMIAVGFVVYFLNRISEGNITGTGLGDYIIQFIGYIAISDMIYRYLSKR